MQKYQLSTTQNKIQTLQASFLVSINPMSFPEAIATVTPNHQGVVSGVLFCNTGSQTGLLIGIT